ncbi:MAG: transcriptional regulator PpsR [Pseudomonadota bacterium]
MTSRGTKYWNSGSIPLIAPDLLGDIIATASDIAIVISDEGQVLSVLINPNHRSFGRLDHWEGRNLRDFLTTESVPKLDDRLTEFQADGASTGAVELNHTDNSDWEFPVRYSFHRVGPDGAVLMLGRDLRPIAEMQQQLVRAQLALERDYEQQRESETRYRVLMEATHEAIVLVTAATGRIADVNSYGATMLGAPREDLIGSAFAQEFDGRKRGEFLESLASSAAAGTAVPVELLARRSRRLLMVTSKIFRAGGERLLLCRMAQAAEGEAISDELASNLSGLFRDGIDAVVFTDRNGLIRAVNESFINLVDAAEAASVKGRPLTEFLSRGSVDMKVLTDNSARTGQMRLYSTKLMSEFGSKVSVEVSATHLNDRAHPVFAFVFRDSSRAEAARSASVSVNDGPARSVMELVGSTTLKDIVAETTDVVEKMCIETAVELTRNNRVAAAEMLGLSRQSLYVKLRKYGLLARGSDNDSAR